MSRILGPNGLPIDPLKQAGYDSLPIPHPLTFASLLNVGWKSYYQSRYDEARRKDPHFAQMMRNDGFLTGLMWERTLAVTSLPWHLEVDDENDPRQTSVRDHLTKLIKMTPDFRGLMKSLQYERTWYGRAGVQHSNKWVDMPFTPPQAAQAPSDAYPPATRTPRDPDGGLPVQQPGQVQPPPPLPPVPLKSLYFSRWAPISGDKIGHMWDGTPFVYVNASQRDQFKDAEFIYSDVGGLGLALRGSWRERVLCHHFCREDTDFFDGTEAAEAIFGVGVRSKVALWQWVRMEWIAKISDFMDRCVPKKIWYSELGNNASYEAVLRAAKNDSIKDDVIIPRSANNKSAGVEYLEASMGNIASLQELVKHVEDQYIRPLVIGQTQSQKGEGSNALGGSGAADAQSDTKGNNTEDDANALAECLTGSNDVHGMVHYLQRHTFPDTLPGRPGGFPVRFVLGYMDPKGKDRLETIQMASEMVPVKAADVYKAAGLTKPTATDELAQKAAPAMDGPPKDKEGGDRGPGGKEKEKKPDGLPENEPVQFAAKPGEGQSGLFDPAAHPHKPPGSPEGGQFTKTGREHLHAALDAHQKSKAAHQAAREKVRAARKNAHTEEGMHAKMRLANAFRHAPAMRELVDDIESDKDEWPEAYEAFSALEEAVGEFSRDEDSPGDMRNDLPAVIEAAEALRDALDAPPQNKESAEKILVYAKAVKVELRAHAKHRRTMRAIRENDTDRFSLDASGHDHKGTGDGGGQFTEPGGGGGGGGTATKKDAKKYGKSKAKAVWSNAKAKDAIRDVMGVFDPEAVASVVGAPDDAEVFIAYSDSAKYRDEIKVRVSHPAYDATYFVRVSVKGEKSIYMDAFFAKEGAKGSGIGTEVFSRQVENAKEADVAYIECHAAKANPNDLKNPHNGFYTWARFGFDQDLDELEDDRLQAKIEKAYPAARTVGDLMAAGPAWRDWWKKNGDDLFHAKFQLKEPPPSRSLQVLEAYQEERAARGSK